MIKAASAIGEIYFVQVQQLTDVWPHVAAKLV